MSKIITDEQELNTAIGDLVTEDYALEILGLQSIADFRKFSRSFMKLSKIVKGVETNVDNNLDEKLNKGAVSTDYDTAKKIEDKVKKIIDEKWKINTKYIGNTSTSTDFNSITANGIYYSSVFNSLFTNGFLGANQQAYSELKLIVMGINNDDSPALKSQLVITRSNDIYLRSCTAWQAPWTWSEWIKIAKMSDLTWGNIGGKPSSFPPSSHTHDDRYYTEAEVNNELAKKLNKGTVSSEYDTAKKIEDKIKKIIDEKWKMNAKYIGNTNTSTDFNSITEGGIYYSGYNNLYINGFLESGQRNYGEFKLIVLGENTESPILKTQIVIERDTNNIHLRSCTAWQAPWTWSEWEKIARMSDVDEKFKNFCPFPVGSVLQMWNETNPTSLYLGTTWELISAGKYVKTGGKALQVGGSNSITLTKDNLPNIKLNTTTARASIADHDHKLVTGRNDTTSYHGTSNQYGFGHIGRGVNYKDPASSGWVQSGGGGTTGTFSLQTETLGSGSAITIQPEFITLKFWKRLS